MGPFKGRAWGLMRAVHVALQGPCMGPHKGRAWGLIRAVHGGLQGPCMGPYKGFAWGLIRAVHGGIFRGLIRVCILFGCVVCLCAQRMACILCGKLCTCRLPFGAGELFVCTHACAHMPSDPQHNTHSAVPPSLISNYISHSLPYAQPSLRQILTWASAPPVHPPHSTHQSRTLFCMPATPAMSLPRLARSPCSLRLWQPMHCLVQ